MWWQRRVERAHLFMHTNVVDGKNHLTIFDAFISFLWKIEEKHALASSDVDESRVRFFLTFKQKLLWHCHTSIYDAECK